MVWSTIKLFFEIRTNIDSAGSVINWVTWNAMNVDVKNVSFFNKRFVSESQLKFGNQISEG